MEHIHSQTTALVALLQTTACISPLTQLAIIRERCTTTKSFSTSTRSCCARLTRQIIQTYRLKVRNLLNSAIVFGAEAAFLVVYTATLHELKLNLSCKQAFKSLLKRVGMSNWTLRFHAQYEESYRVHLLNHAIKRIRYTMAVGFVFVLLKEFMELFQSKDNAWTVRSMLCSCALGLNSL